MFGVKQISDFIAKTGKNTFTLKEFAEVLNVRETSARRYLHEASRLSLVSVKDGVYVVDENRLTIIMEAVWGLNDVDSLLKFLRAIEKKGVIKNVNVKKEERGGASSFVFELITGQELDQKIMNKLNAALSEPNSKILCTIVPSYLTTELLLLIKNRLNLPATSFLEISPKVTVISFEKEEKKE
jgi:hypothetical protein